MNGECPTCRAPLGHAGRCPRVPIAQDGGYQHGLNLIEQGLRAVARARGVTLGEMTLEIADDVKHSRWLGLPNAGNQRRVTITVGRQE